MKKIIMYFLIVFIFTACSTFKRDNSDKTTSSTTTSFETELLDDLAFIDCTLSLKKDLYYSMNFLVTAEVSVLHERGITAADISNFVNKNEKEVLEVIGLHDALRRVEANLSKSSE